MGLKMRSSSWEEDREAEFLSFSVLNVLEHLHHSILLSKFVFVDRLTSLFKHGMQEKKYGDNSARVALGTQLRPDPVSD